MSKIATVGGQAVIEGVMMRGSKGIATAVRKPDGEIVLDIQDFTPYSKRSSFLGLPIIRGFVALFEAMVIGIKTLNYSATFFEEEGEYKPSRFEKWFEQFFKDKSNDVLTILTVIISFGMATLLFFILPTFIANIFKRVGVTESITLNIFEGVIRVGVFILYVYLVGKMEDIKRVFEYHGAEHKAIFCYENDMELTPENAMKFGRFHPRCGTNFMFLVMIVSIILFSLTGWQSLFERIFWRLLLLPLVSGIAYEIIKWMGRSQGKLSKVFAYPGLALQKLTTREPDYAQLEVAIVALKAAEGIEEQIKLKDIEENLIKEEDNMSETNIQRLLMEGYKQLKQVDIDSYQLDCQLLLGKVIGKDRLYIITNKDEIITIEKAERYRNLIQKRKNKMPVKYILEECEFMGLSLYIKEGVLIPRGDTEVLVETVMSYITKKGYRSVCDVCSGSGAIGLSLAKLTEVDRVVLYDIAEEALQVAAENIKRLNVQDKTTVFKSDLLLKAIEEEKLFDIVVSNPPYIREAVIEELMEDVKNYEPHIALCGGKDGLDFYRQITAQSKKVLKNGGLLAFEIGFDQKEQVTNILHKQGYDEVLGFKDLAGRDRVVLGINKLDK